MADKKSRRGRSRKGATAEGTKGTQSTSLPKGGAPSKTGSPTTRLIDDFAEFINEAFAFVIECVSVYVIVYVIAHGTGAGTGA